MSVEWTKMIKLAITVPFLLAVSAYGQSKEDRFALVNLGSVHVPGGVEIVSYDPFTENLYAIGSSGWMVFEFDELNRFSILHSGIFSSTDNWQATSIATDPLGRGFVACSWIPDPTDRVPGVVQIIDTTDNKVVWQFSAGYHPDCIAFSPDGRYLIAANECEPGVEDRPGGISLIDISNIEEPSDFGGFNDVQTFGFTDEYLHESVNLDMLRITPSLRSTPEIDIEPEYLAPTNSGVWVGLQENNGLAYFDFTLLQWTKVKSLGTLSIAFDSNDTDGLNISTRDGFGLLPQPDTIAITRINDREYIVLANEGEKADADTIRFGDAVDAGLIDPHTIERLNDVYPGDGFSDLRRLWISTIDGDLDDDGDIDMPTALGGRSISILDADTGSLVWNSGSQMERISAARWPKQYNSDDSRSDRSGPEPEGIAIGKIGNQTFAFVGLERSDVVFMYDISDPISPVFLDAQSLDVACQRPEGLTFFSLFDRHFLAVASEKGGCLTIFEVRAQ